MVTGRELEDTDDDLPIVVHDPQIWSREEGTGAEFDGRKHERVVRAMRTRFPEERISREYESFLCFELNSKKFDLFFVKIIVIFEAIVILFLFPSLFTKSFIVLK